MKRFFSCLFLILLVTALILPVNADFRNPSITDEAGYLVQSELDSLSKELDKVRKKYGFEVAIYTESNMTSSTAEASADDIYDGNGYGAGEDDDGILLYVCSNPREYHFTVHGKGLKYFNSNGLAYLESKVVPCLSEDDYCGAFEIYIKTADELLEMATDGKPFNEKQYSVKYLIFVIVAALLLPLLAAFIMMNKKLKKMKTAVENDYAANYIKPGSMRINVSRDLFLYSKTTKTEKAKSSSETHTSSSGRTHGGRGGSF